MEYRIASINMERFGAYAKKDLTKIAEIITNENLDVVAMQEIFSEGKGVKRLLEEFVKYELYDWDVCFPDPEDTAHFKPYGETYAYLWNKRKFKLIAKNWDTNIDRSAFIRAPFYIRLQPCYGGFFELRLINIHIYLGDKTQSSVEKRRNEFKLLTKEVYPSLSTRVYGNNRVPYTIAMGDYNLNIYCPTVQTADRNCYLNPIYTYSDGRRQICIQTVQNELSTLKHPDNENSQPSNTSLYANNFDHFTYSQQLSDFTCISVGTIDAVDKYCGGDATYYRENISDHLPIVMEIKI